MSAVSRVEYLPVDGDLICTVIAAPDAEGKFPSVIIRSPYEHDQENMADAEVASFVTGTFAKWLDAGYAVFFQHCRGTGKSTGDCVPFIHEREEGLAVQEFVRRQPFYNGEIYLPGSSYTSAVHYATAPFADDIRGASFESMDSERYGMHYRNGMYKMGLFGAWHASLYKRKSGNGNRYSNEEYLKRPLTEFTRRVFGEEIPDYDAILRHPKRDDPFWDTRFGGSDARDATRRAGIPLLLTVGTVDTFTHGVLAMWDRMDPGEREKCALIIHPYHHGGNAEEQPFSFECGELEQRFGSFDVAWMEHVRRGDPSPVPLGGITYYEQFGAGWLTDDLFNRPSGYRTFRLGEGVREYRYDPERPTEYHGGLTHNFGGSKFMAPPGREDVVTFYTSPAESDVRVRGSMKLKIAVSSDCPDTCFYVRIGIAKKEGDYAIRDDIDQISNHRPDYVPGDKLDITFDLDSYAGVIKAGERLRVDVASAAYPLFVPHTNTRGLFSEQTETRVAHNRVFADECFLSVGSI